MKIGNLYNTASFESFSDSLGQSGFADAFNGTVLSRNLTVVNPKLLEKKYPELTFVNSGITAENTGGFAKRIQSLRLIELGEFKEAGNDSDNGGKISLSAEDSFLKVKERQAETSWTRSEIEEAKMQNINIPSQYISATNRIYLREVDLAGFVGIGTQTGLLNDAAFTSTAASGLAGVITAQALYDEISALVNDQFDGVNNTPEYMANMVTMPTGVFNVAQHQMLNTAGGTTTVLAALRANLPGITFNSSQRANVVGGGSVTVAYSTNPDAMVFRLPVPLQIGEVVKTGSFSFKTDYMYRVAGLDVLEGTAGRLLTGL